jgi:adenylate kinase
LGENLDCVIEMQVDDDALVARITARSTCGACGEVFNDDTKPIPADGKCTNCGASDFQRRADDNEESLRTRLMAYYKQTSPLVGYYHAKGDLVFVDGMASMNDVATSIASALRQKE